MAITVDDAVLFAAINAWEADAPMSILLDIGALKQHMLQENGLVFDTYIGLRGAQVVDEKKYMMFLLRYS